MDKIDKPRKLIGYTTIRGRAAGTRRQAPQVAPATAPKAANDPLIRHMGGIGFAMLFAHGTRNRIEMDVAQSRNPVWIRLSDGQVRNSYAIKLRNMENRPPIRTFGARR